MSRRVLHFNGINADVDIGTEDLIASGASAVFPAAAATTTVISSDTNDDGSPVGTGARTVRVRGLNAALKEVTEDATLNGTGAVTLTTLFFRVWSVEVLTAGSGLANAGTIDVKHSSDILARIAVGANRSEIGFFTAPSADVAPVCRVTKLYGSLLNAPTAGVAIFTLQTRTSGGMWMNRTRFAVYTTGQVSESINCDIALSPGEDVRLRATVTADNSSVAGGFEVETGRSAQA